MPSSTSDLSSGLMSVEFSAGSSILFSSDNFSTLDSSEGVLVGFSTDFSSDVGSVDNSSVDSLTSRFSGDSCSGLIGSKVSLLLGSLTEDVSNGSVTYVVSSSARAFCGTKTPPAIIRQLNKKLLFFFFFNLLKILKQILPPSLRTQNLSC